jgi:hypothetical protein
VISRESLARYGTAAQAAAKPASDAGFDMDAYLSKHAFVVIRRKPWQSHPGGLIYEISVCPFNADHIAGSAAFTTEGGKPGFRCQHDGCKGKTIKDVFVVYPAEQYTRTIVSDWPALIQLTRKTPDPIPTNCLPDWLGEMAKAVAESTETPFDLAALLATAVASSCVAGKADISPEHGYVEPLNVFVCPAMESGNRKTAVFTRLVAPLTEWERLEVERTEPDRRRLQSERRTIEGRVERLRKQAAAADDPRALMLQLQQLENDLPNVPPFPRLFLR